MVCLSRCGINCLEQKARSYNGYYGGLSIRSWEFDSPTGRQVLRVFSWERTQPSKLMKSVRIRPPAPNARLAELVDALVLEASVERRASSSLAVGTKVFAE